MMDLSTLKIKVCGMRNPANILALAELAPDYIGFIFYPRSARYVGSGPIPHISPNIKKVGVFVNACEREIANTVNKYQLDMVQLHGNESPELCALLRNSGIEVVKAFHVDQSFNGHQLQAYQTCTDFFLFDTKTALPGGSGHQFDWQILSQMIITKPVFLSGGIGPDDLDKISQIESIPLHAIDVNSRFEDAPAQKNIPKLADFMHQCRNAMKLKS
jgi:phosphoribosylanthranilate isomerase